MKAKRNNFKNEVVAVLYNVRSLHNVGSIFRTADGAGVKKIYLCGITPSPLDRFGKFIPQFTKVSLGAERFVEWDRRYETQRVIKELKQKGYKILAIEQAKNSVLYYKSKLAKSKSKIALVVGAEVEGLPQSILRCADEIFEIPMRGALVRNINHPRRTGRGKESLNVAVAFGVVAYTINQRSKIKYQK